MNGDNKTTSTQTSNSEPWAAAQPALKTGLSDAQNLYKTGLGSQAYTGSTVVPFAQQTSQGMNSIQNIAGANSGGNGLSGQYGSAIQTGGFNFPQMQGLDGINKFARGSGDVSTQRIDQLGNSAMNNPAMAGYGQAAGGGMGVDTGGQRGLASAGTAPSYSEQNLMGVARGDMLNRSDPNFERALSAASQSAANQINQGASASGRYGSAIHQGNVAREVGNYEANARVGQYNQERQNQMAANQMVDGQRMQGMGFSLNALNSASGLDQFNRNQQMQGIAGQGNLYSNSLGQALGAAGQSAGIQSNNYGRQIAALQQQFNAGQQGFNNLGTAYDGMKAPAQDLMGVGSMYEDLAGRLKNDELRIFQEQQNSPWDQLGRLNGVAGGMGSMGGSGTQVAQTPGQSPFATGLGYASTGMGLLGSAKNLGWF